MNFLELQTEVATRLRESLDSMRYWSVQDIKDALNDGYENISDMTEWYEVILALPFCARRTYYDLRGLRVPVLSVLHAYNMQTQRWLQPCSVRDLDGTYRQWEHVQGQPERYTIRALNLLGAWPRPPQDIGSLRLSVTSIPPPMEQDTDVPGFDEDLHWSLADYAMYELKSDDREVQTSLGYFASYLKGEEELRARIETRQSLDKVHVLGRP